MYETIDERVDCVAVFGTNFHDLKPHKIKWRNKVHDIDEVGYKHKVREGSKVMHIFSCTSGSNFFELKFDANDIKWTLSRTWDGETN